MTLPPRSHRLLHVLLSAIALLFCLAITAFAADSPVSSTGVSSQGFLSALLPPVLDLAATVLAMLGAWLVGLLVRLIGISDTAKRLEVEAKLREALHFAAENGLRFALARAGLSAGAAPTAEILADAMFYVRDKNPDTLQKLRLGSKGLEAILLSKWPLVGHGLAASAAPKTS